jgi:hypothetical protein
MVLSGGLPKARIEWGRIVVDCPSPHCRSALTVPPGWPLYACWDCPAIGGIVWPDNLADIASVLWLRPDPSTRGWNPGESLETLVGENIAHRVGIGEHGEALPAEGGPVLLIVNGRIVDGHPALTGPLAQARRAITQLGLVRALDPDFPDPNLEMEG